MGIRQGLWHSGRCQLTEFACVRLYVCVATLQVYVIRTLRQRADRPMVKAGKAPATITIAELQAASAFQQMSFGHDADLIARMLKEE